MKIPSHFLLLLLLFLGTTLLHAQENTRPKVGLVLSGGGAKGFAHVGVIRKLEEHGIVPDYITGTSMGSIVGALYAIGYTPDQMEEIIRTVNWDEVISNRVGYDKVSFEEKYFYDRYFFGFPADDWKISLPSALIEGQNLQLLLSRLTEPVHGVRDFNQFPIPFKCVGANIENGKPVVLDTGDIVQAIRASMAIPTVFTPVLWDSLLLVDGGLVRNFPVEEAKAMGAEVIIGSYVGGGFKKKEELNSLVSILSQAAFVTSIYDSEEQMKHVDVLIQPDLDSYTAGDFNEGMPIVQRGYESAQKAERAIDSLAQIIGVDSTKVASREGILLSPAYRFERIEVTGNKNYPDKLIKGRMKVEPGLLYSLEKLEEELNLAFGIQAFAQVSYRILPGSTDSSNILKLVVKEAPRNTIQTALHYDTENNVGLVLNYTSRNALLKGSRFIVELDFADNPRLTTSYFKYIGKQQKVAAYGAYYLNRFRSLDIYDPSGASSSFGYVANRFDLGLQTTYLRNSTLGVRFRHRTLSLNPRVSADTLIRAYDEKANELEGYIRVNTTNARYFPDKGHIMNISVLNKWSTDVDVFAGGSVGDVLDSLDVFGSYTTLSMDLEGYIPLRKNVSLLYGGVISASLRADSLETRPQIMDYKVWGGFNPMLPNSHVFYGSPAYSHVTALTSFGFAGVQFKPTSSIVLRGVVNYFNNGWFETIFNTGTPEALYTGGNDLLGAGLTASYLSVVGPVTVGVSRNNKEKTYYGFIGIGMVFGKYP
jgi:NTE family protein